MKRSKPSRYDARPIDCLREKQRLAVPERCTDLKILQLCPQVPYPLSDGGKVGIFNITKHLALRGHEITMLALDVRNGDDVGPLRTYCRLMTVPHSNKNSFLGAFVNLFSTVPYNISKYKSKEFEHRLRSLIRTERFDIVHVDHLHMSEYGLLCREEAGLPVALREHNVESTIMERFARTTQSKLLQVWLRLQVPRIRSYEARQTQAVDCCCVITGEDELRLKKLAPTGRTVVIPAGVEEAFFDQDQGRARLPDSIAFIGNFEWLPNKDALMWFLNHILPLIRQERQSVRVFIVGKNIPDSVLKDPPAHVVIRGFVPDIRAELSQYEVMVVPLRVGGGMRLKILESFAQYLPVVSTSIGCEGIEAEAERHLLVADSDQDFARETLRLLGDQGLQRKLAANAFQLVMNRYKWSTIAEQFEKVYERVVAEAGRHPREDKTVVQ